MVKLFRQRNPETIDFEVVTVWSKPEFKTFREWTLLLRVGEQYIFFYALEELETQQFSFWGQQHSSSPEKPNPQRHALESEIEEARELIRSEFPETEGLPMTRALVRDFPEGRRREAIVLRHSNSRVRYVVLRENEEQRIIKEWETIEENLPDLDESAQKQEELVEKVEVIVEEVLEGKEVSPEVNLKEEESIEVVVETEVENQE